MLGHLTTESRNDKTMNLDSLEVIEILKIMNNEDQKVAFCIQEKLPLIAEAVKLGIHALQKGGRLIYLGAGTSGRIGLLDAVECPPTFNTQFGTVVGIIAGGSNAFIQAVEGAEDDSQLAAQDLENINLSKNDLVIGIAASGRTPYVIGGLTYANTIGASTVAVSCNENSEIGKLAKVAIEVITGPEILTGSTRLKAGTAQKLICNMISTATMIGVGKVYKNLMVDLRPTNKKLEERAKRIVMDATECSYELAESYLYKANQHPKAAIVMILTNISYEEAIERLETAKGFIKDAL